MADPDGVSIDKFLRIRAAARRLDGVVRRTPLLSSPPCRRTMR